MDSPLISIIIPLYNKVAIVERSVQSVLSQSFTDFELIVVDDGSTDGSAEVVEGMQDERITLIRQENGGPGKARNTGVKNVHGEWAVFLDADDELLPSALQTFWDIHLQHNGADIIDCSTQLRLGNTLRLRTHQEEGFSLNNFRDWLYGDLMPGTGHSMFRMELVRKCPYDERLRRYEDAELLFRLLPQARRYKSLQPTFVVNTGFSSASYARKDIKEDFMGYLSFRGKSFWEKMCLYAFFLSERECYKEACRQLYSSWYWRYDLFFLYKLLPRLRFLFYRG